VRNCGRNLPVWKGTFSDSDVTAFCSDQRKCFSGKENKLDELGKISYFDDACYSYRVGRGGMGVSIYTALAEVNKSCSLREVRLLGAFNL
jgi:hypothetical protein